MARTQYDDEEGSPKCLGTAGSSRSARSGGHGGSSSRPGTSMSRKSGGVGGTGSDHASGSRHGGESRPVTSLTVGSLGVHSLYGGGSRPSTSGGQMEVRPPPRLAYISRMTNTAIDDKSDMFRQLERALKKLATPRDAKEEMKPKYMQWRKEVRPTSALVASLTKNDYDREVLPLNRSHLQPIGALDIVEDAGGAPGDKKKKKKKKKKNRMAAESDEPELTTMSVDDLDARTQLPAKRAPLSPLKFDAYKREMHLLDVSRDADLDAPPGSLSATSPGGEVILGKRSSAAQILLLQGGPAKPAGFTKTKSIAGSKGQQVFMGGMPNTGGQYVSDARGLVDQAQKLLDRRLPKPRREGGKSLYQGSVRSVGPVGSERSMVSSRPGTARTEASDSTGAEHVSGDCLQPVSVHGKLLAWAIGLEDVMTSTALPDVRAKVWAEDKESDRRYLDAVTVIQKEWRRHMQYGRYERYKAGRARRRLAVMGNVLSLWLRVILQRPGARVLCSQFLIAWRVYVREGQIANDKAQDIVEVWGVVCLKRNLKHWRSALSIGKHARGLVYAKHFYGAFVCWWEYQKRWKDMRARNMGTFVWHANRALFFYSRCARKIKQRSFRLFRFFTDSVDPLSMPVSRFKGYGNLFNCEDLLEIFRRKDQREMRIMRLVYTRIMPKMVIRWSIFVDNCKKIRYAIMHSYVRLLRRGLHKLKENADEMAELREQDKEKVQRISGLSDAERLAREKDDEGLATEMDTLADLVDHEEKEQLRRMLKEEKRKLIIRMRFDQLKRETLVLQQMPAKYDDSMRQLERMVLDREKIYNSKLADERKLANDEKKMDGAQWDKSIAQYKRVLQDGFEILEGVLEHARQNYSADVFYTCWCYIRKAAGRTRVRRVISRTWIQRMLAICSRHRRMLKSVHRYRRLRVMWGCWLKWLHLVEDCYIESTPGLKERVKRRRALSLCVSDILTPIGRLLSIEEACKRIDVCFALWLERTESVKSRREVTYLWNMRRAVRLIHRSFDFLKTRVIWRERVKQLDGQGPGRVRPWVERNASADLNLWKRKFFSGVGYAEMLRTIEEKLKGAFMHIIKGQARLPQLISDRRKEVDRRVKYEQRLLLMTLDEIESGKDENASSKRGVFASSFPVNHWGTVLNLRRNEVMTTLDRIDAFARLARHEFDSAKVAFYLSEWLFRVKCEGLPKEGDSSLTTSKRYWKNIKNLFQFARTGQIHIKGHD